MLGWRILPIAFLAPLLTFIAVFLLTLPPPWRLWRCLAWRYVFRACPWRLLLTPDGPLLRLRPLILDGRASLLRLSLRWGWPLNVFASPFTLDCPLLWLPALIPDCRVRASLLRSPLRWS